jgi:transposase InsO family protein
VFDRRLVGFEDVVRVALVDRPVVHSSTAVSLMRATRSTAGYVTNCSTHGASDSLREAPVIIEDWRCDYNANRPHSAHGELTPTEFAPHLTTTHQPQAA